MHNFNHLYYFYITAKSGGVGIAAQHLRISQPSLSSQLKVLERALDIRLFQKIGRNNHLTQAGLVVYGLCRNMFEISEELNEIISKKMPSITKRIHIGVSHEVDRSFVDHILQHFFKSCPLPKRPRFNILSGDIDQLAEKLRFREIDLVVSEEALNDPDLKTLKNFEIPVRLVCSKKWTTSGIKKILHMNIENNMSSHNEKIKWLMPSSKFKLRSEINHFLEKGHIKGKIVFESDQISSIIAAVSNDIGFSLLPSIYILKEIQNKSIKFIGSEEGFWKYKIWLTSHKQNMNDNYIYSLTQSFKDICQLSNFS